MWYSGLKFFFIILAMSLASVTVLHAANDQDDQYLLNLQSYIGKPLKVLTAHYPFIQEKVESKLAAQAKQQGMTFAYPEAVENLQITWIDSAPPSDESKQSLCIPMTVFRPTTQAVQVFYLCLLACYQSIADILHNRPALEQSVVEAVQQQWHDQKLGPVPDEDTILKQQVTYLGTEKRESKQDELCAKVHVDEKLAEKLSNLPQADTEVIPGDKYYCITTHFDEPVSVLPPCDPSDD